MLAWVFRCSRGSAVAALFGVGLTLATGHAWAEEEAVRVLYVAPAACPDEAAFVARVRVRTQHGRFAEPGELARTFDVSLTRSPDTGFDGHIEFVDVDGEHAHRNVSGTTCDELASSLALIMALSIDDRVAQVEAREHESLPSPALAAPSEPPKKAKPSATSSSTEPPGSNAGARLHLRWDVGANAGVLTWVAPKIAPAFGGFVALGSREQGFSARLSAFDARQTEFVRAGQTARFATDWLRLEVCPTAVPLASTVSLSPCAAFDGGAIRAAGEGEGLVNKKSQAWFWASGVALLRLGFSLADHLLLSLDGELAAPFVRRDFFFRYPPPASARTRVHRVPALGAGAKFGVAVRFP